MLRQHNIDQSGLCIVCIILAGLVRLLACGGYMHMQITAHDSVPMHVFGFWGDFTVGWSTGCGIERNWQPNC